jgi:hypothetical protein
MLNYKKRKYHFFIPNYTDKSNGIKTLWLAAKEFSQWRNVTVESFAMGEIPCALPLDYQKLIGKFDFDDNTVVIYPDCVSGNPLQAKKVARYMMAKPFILNGASIGDIGDDFLFAYSHAVNIHTPQYNLLPTKDFSGLDFSYKAKRNKVSIYYGKVRFCQNFEKLDDLINKFEEVYVITRSFPEHSKTLFDNIAESKLLICLDPLSNIAYEATLMGTPVLMADDVFKDEYDHYNYPLNGFYYSNLSYDFINEYEFINLAESARLIYEEQVCKNKEKTLKIIDDIEIHFSTKRATQDFSKIINDDVDFFEHRWKMSPIFNCTTANSIIGYHIAKKSIIIYSFLRFCISIKKRLNETLVNIKKGTLSQLKVFVVFCLGPDTLSFLIYKTAPLRYKSRFLHITELMVINDQKSDFIDKEPNDIDRKSILPVKLLKFLWRYFK